MTYPSQTELLYWKTYPVRITHPHFICCGEPTILVQSMDGGFITHNCLICGKKHALTNEDFLKKLNLWVSCRCGERMNPEIIRKSYGYRCVKCQIGLKLSDLLPKWDKI